MFATRRGLGKARASPCSPSLFLPLRCFVLRGRTVLLAGSTFARDALALVLFLLAGLQRLLESRFFELLDLPAARRLDLRRLFDFSAVLPDDLRRHREGRSAEAVVQRLRDVDAERRVRAGWE